MTRQKSFKARVRARMEKTGESYTAARRRLLAGADKGEAPEAGAAEGVGPVEEQRAENPGTDPPGVRAGNRRMSDEAIRGRTGRGFDEWFALLDGWGAAERSHPEIARWLADQHEIGSWSAQSVTVAYELARGLRAPGQRPDGFAVSASKTVAVPVERLFEAFADEDLRSRWLGEAALEIRTARPPSSLRAKLGGRHTGERRLLSEGGGQEPGGGRA